MANKNTLGGIIHTYQKYDPVNLPAPTQPPPDLVSPALEHFLMFGDARRLTDEELARAIHLDPSQIAGLGPSLDALEDVFGVLSHTRIIARVCHPPWGTHDRAWAL